MDTIFPTQSDDGDNTLVCLGGGTETIKKSEYGQCSKSGGDDNQYCGDEGGIEDVHDRMLGDMQRMKVENLRLKLELEKNYGDTQRMKVENLRLEKEKNYVVGLEFETWKLLVSNANESSKSIGDEIHVCSDDVEMKVENVRLELEKEKSYALALELETLKLLISNADSQSNGEEIHVCDDDVANEFIGDMLLEDMEMKIERLELELEEEKEKNHAVALELETLKLLVSNAEVVDELGQDSSK